MGKSMSFKTSCTSQIIMILNFHSFSQGVDQVNKRNGPIVDTWAECQQHCQSQTNPSCTYWTWAWQFCTNCDEPKQCTVFEVIRSSTGRRPGLEKAFGHISGRVLFK